MQHLGELINATYRLLNATRTQRWEVDSDVVPAINVGIRQYVQDFYDDLKKSGRKYSFETNQRIKSSLRSLVVANTPLTFTGNIATLPDDYWYDVGLNVKLVGRIMRPSTSLSFNEKNASTENYLDRPVPEDIYHLEYGKSIEIKFGGGIEKLETVLLDYLKEPQTMTAIPFESGSLLLVGKKYWIEEGTLNDGTTTYTEGSVFTAAASVAATITGSVFEISDIEMPSASHDAIAALAARYLTGNSGDYERKNNANFESDK